MSTLTRDIPAHVSRRFDIEKGGIMLRFCRETASLVAALALITIGTASAEED